MNAAQRLIALAALLAMACTDVNLYSETIPPREADRVTLTGRVCADDPVTARYPVRAVLLVDQAAGPLFADYDAAARRVTVLTGFMQSALSSSNVALAVVGYAGRAQKLAPTEGTFTRNPGELLNALNRLTLAEPCLAPGQCRDYLDGLRSARAVIEADMATLPAGSRVLTQYVVIHINAGPHAPLAQTPPAGATCAPEDGPFACQYTREVAEVDGLRRFIDDGGGAGLAYHVIHLAAEADADLNDRVADGLSRMALAGRGLFQRFNAVAGFSGDALDLLDVRTQMSAKRLLVSNRHAKPTPDGPVPDTDADGLSDAEELTTGTSPGDADTDGDGIGDLVEVLVGLPPLTPDAPVACEAVNAFADTDRDGLGDCDERLIGTDTSLVDTDGDGMPDRLELVLAVDYLHADAEGDLDGDGVVNGDEVLRHSDPRSSDVASHLTSGYRYTVTDEGVVEERAAAALTNLTGVDIVGISPGTTAGLGTLSWFPTLGLMSWKDAGEPLAGPPVEVLGDGEITLPASSFAPIQGDEGRFITVDISAIDLPPSDVIETVRVTLRQRQCLSYTVRNVRLMATGALDADPEGAVGGNDIVLYFAQAPNGRLTVPGPFRLALVPFVFAPPAVREPAGAVIDVFDGEFIRPRP